MLHGIAGSSGTQRCYTDEPCSTVDYPTTTRVNAPYARLSNFDLDKKADQRYQQQYGDMYFLRLAKLKPAVERIATDAWEGYQVCISDVLEAAGNSDSTEDSWRRRP